MVELKFFAKMIIATVLSFFLPVAQMAALVGFFIIGDTILGIWASHKRGEKFTSRRFSSIITKMLLYQGALLTGYMTDVWLIGEFLEHVFSIKLLLTKGVTLTLLYTEMVSIDENFNRVTGNSLFAKAKELLTRLSTAKDMTKKLN
jgi:hypothetical protein